MMIILIARINAAIFIPTVKKTVRIVRIETTIPIPIIILLLTMMIAIIAIVVTIVML